MEEEILFKIEFPSKDAVDSLEKIKLSIIKLKEEQARLTKEYKSGEISADKYAKELVQLEGELKKQTSSYNENLKASKGVTTQFDKLIKSNENLSESVKESNEQNKASIESFKVQGVSIGDLTGKFKDFVSGIGLASAAVGALVSVLFRGRQAQEALSRVQAASSSVLDKLTKDTTELVTAMDEGSSNKPGFLGVLIKANPIVQLFNLSMKGLDFVTGGYISSLKAAAEEGAKFEGQLQKIRIETLTNTQASKDLLRQEEEQRQIRDNVTKSIEERSVANEKILVLEKQRRDLLVDVAQRELDVVSAQVERIGRANASIELLQHEAELINEIADIREDSAGKESEALVNRINLQTELNARLFEESEIERAKRIRSVEDSAISNEQVSESELALQNSLKEIREKGAADSVKATDKILKARLDAIQNTSQAQKNADAEEKQAQLNKVATIQSVVNQGTAILKQGTIAANLAALAQAVVNTYAAANLALKTYPPPFGAIAAATNIALGLVNVAKIKSNLGFADGGLVEGFAGGGLSGTRIMGHHGRSIRRSNGDNLLATVKTGEVILNERQQARLGGAATFRAIGVPGFASGGSTALSVATAARNSESIGFQREIFNAISQIRPVVTVEDINTGQTRVDVIDSFRQVQ